MKKLFFGAVSVSALMLAAACGDSDNTYETSQSDAAEETGRTAANEDDSAYADASGAQSWDEENYRELEDRSPSERLPVSRTAQAPGAAAAPARAKTRAEIELLAAEAFASADANSDGAIDQQEYIQLALASARDFDSFVTEPAKLMPVNPVADPQIPAGDEAGGVAAADDAMPEEVQDQAASSAQTAEAAPVLDDAEAATIETAAAQTFEEAAGGDGELTPEELSTAFLSRFDQADEDGDEALDATELQTFAALTRGEQTAPADGNN